MSGIRDNGNGPVALVVADHVWNVIGTISMTELAYPAAVATSTITASQ